MMYQVIFKRFFTLHHLADNEDGKCLCGKNWIAGDCNDIFEIPANEKIEECIGCKICLKIYKNRIYEKRKINQGTKAGS